MFELKVLPCGLISRKEAARFLGLKAHTLACWNSAGKHDEFFEKRLVGSRVYYDFKKVKEFAGISSDEGFRQ